MATSVAIKRVLKGSPFRFEKHGQSGLEISEVLPYLSQHADDLCFIRSMQTDSANHSNASLCLHTGSANFVRPSVGSWVIHGLDSENESLPGFITIRPMRSLGSRLHSNAFLLAVCQGTAVGPDGVSAKQATIRYLHNADAFTGWLAGGGVRGGYAHGMTDDHGAKAVEDRVHVHDLHATILHLMGLNHEQLTYPGT
jgi:hypothetical protein